jgi:transposase
MRRYELSDEQYELIAPLLPKSGGVGRPWADHRQVLNGLFWKLSSGASWRDIPERYGSWQTIYERYTAWRADGTWQRIVQVLQVKLDATGHINWAQWNIDSTLIRASRAAGGARKKGVQRQSRKTMP